MVRWRICSPAASGLVLGAVARKFTALWRQGKSGRPVIGDGRFGRLRLLGCQTGGRISKSGSWLVSSVRYAGSMAGAGPGWV